MKKTLIALAALAASGAVFAQATISGSINVGIQDTGALNSKAAVASLGGGANAINIATTEDLGGGLKAGFTGQIRFNASTGDMGSSSGGGTALMHAANVFVSGGFGTVRVGKIAEASNCAFDPWGCTGVQGLASGTAGTLIAAGTQASSVSYVTPTISGFSAGYQTSVSTRNNERNVFNINYAQGPISAQYLRAGNGVASGTDALTVAGDVKSTDQSIAASYNFGVATVSYINAVKKNAAGTKTAKINALGLTVPMDAYTILAGYSKDSVPASNADTKLTVGVNYALSKRTTVGADLFKNEAAGAGTGYTLRVRHTF